MCKAEVHERKGGGLDFVHPVSGACGQSQTVCDAVLLKRVVFLTFINIIQELPTPHLTLALSGTVDKEIAISP